MRGPPCSPRSRAARDRIAAAEVTFRFLRCRQPKIAPARIESSQATSLTVADRLTVPQRGAEGSADFGGVAALFDGFFEVEGEFLFDVAAGAISAKNILRHRIATSNFLLFDRP
jgi:hypothetical protein